jgi:hypothetical protein
MNILDALGLDAQTMHWQDLAACRGIAGEVKDSDGNPLLDEHGERVISDPMFDSYENDSAPYPLRKAVDQLCLSCPVQDICLNAGRMGRETGVYGGVYLVNGKQDRTRNEHKTKDVWQQIIRKVGKL